MNAQPKPGLSGSMMKLGMMACCAIMLAPVAVFILAGGTIGGLWSGAAIFAPLLLCVGAHVLIHRAMNKSGQTAAPETHATVTDRPTDTQAQRATSPDVTAH